VARQAVRTALKHALWFLLYGALGVVLTLLVVFVLHLEGRPELDVWHEAELDEEFTAEKAVTSFEEYLALEERLFAQLDERVYARTGPAGNDRVNRYKRGSLSDPQRWTPNWNRSFEMPVAAPRASVLLLHGLSDSPYSLRALGERLHAAGAHVLGLRIPGHGTAPSGLVTVRWQDMAAAVRLAAEHLASRNPGRPLYIVGYSNGAALAVLYALDALEDPGLPQADRLVLLSPEIGVTAAAAFAVWQARLGYLLGLDKLAWNDILPEYEPFKYGSFAVNAGDLSHRITSEIQRRLDRLEPAGTLQGMPPVLAFSSAVDATVLPVALVQNLYNRLPPGGHELVVYDINRVAGIEHLLTWSPQEMVAALQQEAGQRFALSVVTNEHPGTRSVHERAWSSRDAAPRETPLGLEWPADVYSLSHVALPFPPGDPVYGGRPDSPSPGVRLGDIARRGERGVLAISPAAMLRLRWNPFYDYQERRVLEFLGLGGPAHGEAARSQ
jgi:alpha-beta hydrolase superfamily lysophospholipase